MGRRWKSLRAPVFAHGQGDVSGYLKTGHLDFCWMFFYEQLILVNKLTNMCCRWLNKAVALAGQIRLKQLGECERLVDVFLVNIFCHGVFAN